jgi:hypothetical protein
MINDLLEGCGNELSYAYNYKLLAVLFLVGVYYYTINWVCGILYDNGYDIFGFLKKKKKNRRS